MEFPFYNRLSFFCFPAKKAEQPFFKQPFISSGNGAVPEAVLPERRSHSLLLPRYSDHPD